MGESHGPGVALFALSDLRRFLACVPEASASDVGVHALTAHALGACEVLFDVWVTAHHACDGVTCGFVVWHFVDGALDGVACGECVDHDPVLFDLSISLKCLLGKRCLVPTLWSRSSLSDAREIG